MAFDAKTELDTMWKKLIHCGDSCWDPIFREWNTAYGDAYKRVTDALKQDWKRPDPALFIDTVAFLLGANPVAAFVFLPIAAGLKELTSKDIPLPPTPDGSLESLVADSWSEFSGMQRVCSRAILELTAQVNRGDVAITESEFKKFLSRALLSPIWYPPHQPNRNALSDDIERRLWALLGKLMLKKSDYYELDLRKMAQRLSDLKCVSLPELYLVATDRPPAWINPLGGGNHYSQIPHKMTFLQKHVKPWMESEMRRPGPFHYPLPLYVKAYLTVVQALGGVGRAVKVITLGSLNEQTLMRLLPDLGLTWSNAPLR
jgi:hypothetical protein